MNTEENKLLIQRRRQILQPPTSLVSLNSIGLLRLTRQPIWWQRWRLPKRQPHRLLLRDYVCWKA